MEHLLKMEHLLNVYNHSGQWMNSKIVLRLKYTLAKSFIDRGSHSKIIEQC